MNKAAQNARLDALNTFLHQTPPVRLSRDLRNLLIEYLIMHRSSNYIDLPELLADMRNLFEFLDELGRIG